MTFVYDIPVKKFDEVLKSSSISSKHFSIEQFKKNYDNRKLNWCMLFDDAKKCVAAACVEEGFGPASNATYVNELQCLVPKHSYGKKMLQMLKKHFVFIWLVADPSVKSDALLKFYRDPDLKLVEDVLPADESIYDVDTHFFSVCGRMPSFLRKSFLKHHYGKQS